MTLASGNRPMNRRPPRTGSGWSVPLGRACGGRSSRTRRPRRHPSSRRSRPRGHGAARRRGRDGSRRTPRTGSWRTPRRRCPGCRSRRRRGRIRGGRGRRRALRGPTDRRHIRPTRPAPSVSPTAKASAALACSRSAMFSTIWARTGTVGGSRPREGASAASEKRCCGRPTSPRPSVVTSIRPASRIRSRCGRTVLLCRPRASAISAVRSGRADRASSR